MLWRVILTWNSLLWWTYVEIVQKLSATKWWLEVIYSIASQHNKGAHTTYEWRVFFMLLDTISVVINLYDNNTLWIFHHRRLANGAGVLKRQQWVFIMDVDWNVIIWMLNGFDHQCWLCSGIRVSSEGCRSKSLFTLSPFSSTMKHELASRLRLPTDLHTHAHTLARNSSIHIFPFYWNSWHVL